VPQAPQCIASEARLVQLPLHSVVPEGQLDAHCPFAHTCVAAHAFPQAPQFLGSFVVATQALPHVDDPVLHVISHCPAWHRGPPFAAPRQTLPQEPQLVMSVAGFVQPPPHTMRGEGQPAGFCEVPESATPGGLGFVFDPSEGVVLAASCCASGRTQMCAELQTNPDVHSPAAEQPFPSRLGIVLLQAANTENRKSAIHRGKVERRSTASKPPAERSGDVRARKGNSDGRGRFGLLLRPDVQEDTTRDDERHADTEQDA
jgi:hypothetical protein